MAINEVLKENESGGRSDFKGVLLYLGTFLIASATVMFEILLTRIFSVTMWHHFAFLAVSIAMFGMTFGATIVYLFPRYLKQERLNFILAFVALLFSVFIVFSFLCHLAIPFPMESSARSLVFRLTTFVVFCVPFTFSGICIALILTRFPGRVNRLYCADLLGAGSSCLLAVLSLVVLDAPSAILCCSLLAALSAVCFLPKFGSAKLFHCISFGCCILFLFMALHNGISAHYQNSWLALRWVKGKLEKDLLYQKWNSFSRISIPKELQKPFGWGFGYKTVPEDSHPQLYLEIDAGAATVLTKFDGDIEKLTYLRSDVTNIAHYIRPNSDLLVIGSGGGRDILSALLFKQKSATAVEINETILHTLNVKYGDYTGHLDRYDHISFINDEARSWLERSNSNFDIIQISLIDTWAATAAGALALSENSLYTVEAYETMIRHLKKDGVISVSRWFSVKFPWETIRLLALAKESLQRFGIQDPTEHVIVITNESPTAANNLYSVATILVSREPFSKQDLAEIKDASEHNGFSLLVGPFPEGDFSLGRLIRWDSFQKVIEDAYYDLSAPVDNRPFFFNLVRPQNIFNKGMQVDIDPNTSAIRVLLGLLLAVLLLSWVALVIPLRKRTNRETRKQARSLTVYFAVIGLGFMLIEISQMQRLAIFLGHPVYSLGVVLFSLLVAAGIGSLISGRFIKAQPSKQGKGILIAIIAALIVFGVLSPSLINFLSAQTTLIRVIAAIVLIAPLGIVMGMAFPLGLALANERFPLLTPWFWGTNGAASVIASVLAVIIALGWGIAVVFWAGTACYVVALVSFCCKRCGAGY